MDEKQAIVEAWKQSLAAKGHFDDITMKIRALFLTLVAAMLGAAGLVNTKDMSALYVGFGLVWLAFYLMDRWWYHYLLLGAVLHSSSLEARAAEVGLRLPPVEFTDPNGKKRTDDNRESHNSILGLTYRISTLQQSSMFGIKAKYKLDVYYLIIGLGILLFAIVRSH